MLTQKVSCKNFLNLTLLFIRTRLSIDRQETSKKGKIMEKIPVQWLLRAECFGPIDLEQTTERDTIVLSVSDHDMKAKIWAMAPGQNGDWHALISTSDQNPKPFKMFWSEKNNEVWIVEIPPNSLSEARFLICSDYKA
jgi:hypothetical protein